MSQIATLQRPLDIPDTGLVCDLLWSDPDSDITGWQENDRGAGYVFGPDAVRAFLEEQELTQICRGHQALEEGYNLSCEGLVITLLSGPRGYALGQRDLKAAVLHLDDKLQNAFQVIGSSLDNLFSR